MRAGCCCGLEPGDLGRCQLCSDPADSRVLDTRSAGSQPRLGCTEEEMNTWLCCPIEHYSLVIGPHGTVVPGGQAEASGQRGEPGHLSSFLE